MYRPRIEALENRQLFAVGAGVDLIPPGGFDVGGPVLTLSPEQSAEWIQWLVQHPGYVVEDGVYKSAAPAYGPTGPLSYQLQLEDLLVSSYRGLTEVANAAEGGSPAAVDHRMAELDDHHVDGIAMTEYLIILSARHSADVINQSEAATDQAMAEQGDGQADAILHEDNEFSFPRMITFGGTLSGWGGANAVRSARTGAAHGFYYLLPSGEL
jgi:hypothetical protein